ncbi:hypothetical protein Scep_007574 [Stephania cephalantha]|uniref:Uncharacterized protein n=1 Tax=Stephania cephalantha TaxID=152367 RepID=A0AAP0KCU7_9MAGN
MSPLLTPQERLMKAKDKPASPGPLSILHEFAAAQTFSSEKGLSMCTDSSPRMVPQLMSLSPIYSPSRSCTSSCRSSQSLA